MLTLSYGFKKPETGDGGSIFFTALEDDIQQLNDHDHNGTNSKRLTTLAATVVTDSVLSANWVVSGDTYRQLKTMPTGLMYDEVTIMFRLTATGEYAFLKVEKASANTFYVYCNDNTKTFTVVYSS